MERTLAIIKPDAVGRKLAGEIIKRIETSGLAPVGLKLMHLSREQAERFYDVHRARPFFGSLCEYMSSGPIVVLALQAEGAIDRWRKLMGATDPAKAESGTIRKQFGVNIERNAVHGSDAPETAARELAFFFSGLDLLS